MPAKRSNLPGETTAAVIELTRAEVERATPATPASPAPPTGLLARVVQEVSGLAFDADQVEEELSLPGVVQDEPVLRAALRDLAACRVMLARAARRLGLPILPTEPTAAECDSARERHSQRRKAEPVEWDWGQDDDGD